MPLRHKTALVALVIGLACASAGGCSGAGSKAGNEADTAGNAAAAANISSASDDNAPNAVAPLNSLTGDALVPETGFTAMGTVSCVTRAGRAPRDCSAGVVRNADGTAIVTIFWPEGRSRAIFFDASHRAIGADTSEADGSAAQPFRATREGRSSVVTIGPERYVISDALVLGA